MKGLPKDTRSACPLSIALIAEALLKPKFAINVPTVAAAEMADRVLECRDGRFG